MKTVSDAEFPSRDEESLVRFLNVCRQQSLACGKPVYASITLGVSSHIDPLAVLQSIVEPDDCHLYLEQGAHDFAVAGAESVARIQLSGEDRFRQAKAFSEDVFSRCLAIGDLDSPMSGPHLMVAFPFEAAPHESVLFLPRWQVSSVQGRYTAVANAAIDGHTDIQRVAVRMLSAHAKFSRFDYSVPRAAPHALVKPEFRDCGNDFRKAVALALEKISQGCFEKIVLGRAIESQTTSGMDPLEWLARLREGFPSCHCLSFSHGKGSFIAASPEKLLKVASGTLFTEAIAGSIKRGTDAREDAQLASELVKSDKNSREHQTVVQSILKRLEALGLTPERPSTPRLLRLGNIQHLKTPIEARIPDSVNIFTLAEALHPTPALGGRPRSTAVPEIRKLEGFDRELFGGIAGWINSRGEGELVVGIRCARVTSGHIRLYAGAGIVGGSDPESEYAETEIKLNALRNTLR